MQVTVLNEVGEELQKEGEHQKPDVHAIDISISCKHNIVVTQTFKTIFNIQSMLQEVKFLVFVYHLFSKTITIQGLSPQAKNCLCINPPAFCNRSTCTIAFCYKYSCLVALFKNFLFVSSLRFIIVMKLAVAQFFVMKICFFCPFVCEFFYACKFFSFSFTLLDTFAQRFRCLLIFMQIIV